MPRELIYKDEAYSAVLHDNPQFAYCINRIKPVDAVEVKHARWVVYESDEPYGCRDSKEWYKCSECGKDAHGRCSEDEWYSFPILSDYCPNCGAKMDGGNEDG